MIVVVAWSLLLLISTLPVAAQPADHAAREAFIDSLVQAMTLEEKLGQLNQVTGIWAETGPAAPAGGEEQVRAGQIGSFLNVFTAEATRGLQEIAVEESRLGIPLLFAHDVIHGFRTIFPVPLGEAASWNPDLVQQAARIAAVEASAHGLHWTFAPMVDIARDPRWGRIVEGAGEDPYLGSVMAAARVRGFQGDDLRDTTTVLATAKHFVAYGAAEGGRDYNVADVSERTLREVYLPPFKAAVEAGVYTIMAAFNEVAGVPMHAHPGLIDGLLRDEWGWDGIVVSDYTGVLELLQHGIAETRAGVGIRALEAGVDIDMISSIYLDDLPEAVRAGQLAEAEVDEAVRRVLRAKWDVGLFDDPYRYSDPARQAAFTMTEAHMAAARQLARESIVLLKNDDATLPLAKDLGTLAVIGPLVDAPREMIGNWTAAGRTEDAVTILSGIRAAVAPGTEVLHAAGTDVRGTDTSGFDEAVRVAEQADAVVLVLGEDTEMSAEANNRTSLDLPGVQRELAEAIVATGTPVVVVLLNGRPLAIPWLSENVPAILEAWYPGTLGGPAIADLIFGDANPSGKLPVTVPRTVGQVPIYYAHKNTGRPPSAEEKYTSKYIDVPWTPLYPFGHGLSYTTFGYDDLRLSAEQIAAGDSLTVSVDVTNTGDRFGQEVVQLYIRDEVGTVTRPVKELRGFEKIGLEPGQAQTVTFTLGPDDLAFYDFDMERVVEPGFFTVFVGGSSEDVTEARFEVVGDEAFPVE